MSIVRNSAYRAYTNGHIKIVGDNESYYDSSFYFTNTNNARDITDTFYKYYAKMLYKLYLLPNRLDPVAVIIQRVYITTDVAQTNVSVGFHDWNHSLPSDISL